MSNLPQSVKGKIIFWRLDPLCPNPRVESNDVKLILIFVLFDKYYCVLSKNFVTYSTATQIYISTTSKTAMTTSCKISKNIQFQNTHAGFTIFSVHSQHLKSSSSAFRPALSNLWLLLVLYYNMWIFKKVCPILAVDLCCYFILWCFNQVNMFFITRKIQSFFFSTSF